MDDKIVVRQAFHSRSSYNIDTKNHSIEDGLLIFIFQFLRLFIHKALQNHSLGLLRWSGA